MTSPSHLLSSVNKKQVAVFLAVLILAGLVYFLKGQLIVATVNGKPVWRLTLLAELEKQSGKEVLDSLITKTLILQEAQKQKVIISEDEITQEITTLEEKIREQGQDLDNLLSLQNMSRVELREQIKIQKMIEKMVGANIQVSDQEIDSYLEENKDFLPQEVSSEEAREDARSKITQQKISEEIQTWINSLKEKAVINYLRNF